MLCYNDILIHISFQIIHNFINKSIVIFFYQKSIEIISDYFPTFYKNKRENLSKRIITKTICICENFIFKSLLAFFFLVFQQFCKFEEI